MRPDDPRLGEVIETWDGDAAALRSGRAVLIGFPQDEGVRRNHGRPGAADAPPELRRWLRRLTPWDGESDLDLTTAPPLDLGDVRVGGGLEESQQALAEVVAAVLERGAVPVVLGGGHETALGHYLGQAADVRPVAVVNVDAHLDVRPLLNSRGHSGSPFRQAMEHPLHPLAGDRYVCLGAQPHANSREHVEYVRQRGGVIVWCGDVRGSLAGRLTAEIERLGAAGCRVQLTVDADAVRAADVPGVSAPNAAGLDGAEVLAAVRLAARSPQVGGLDLAEINPRHDADGRSARWGALLLWNFLVGQKERAA